MIGFITHPDRPMRRIMSRCLLAGLSCFAWVLSGHLNSGESWQSGPPSSDLAVGGRYIDVGLVEPKPKKPAGTYNVQHQPIQPKPDQTVLVTASLPASTNK